MAIEFNCEFCGLLSKHYPGQLKRWKHHFCSRGCTSRWYSTRRKSRVVIAKRCRHCQCTFMIAPWERDRRLYCSPKCRQLFHSAVLTCAFCRKTILKARSRIRKIKNKRQFCSRKHYLRWLKHQVRKGVDSQGYVWIRTDGGTRKFEHRLLMEMKLKRKLRRYETVHHKNGIRTDNRLRNLELWAKAHPAGQRVSDMVKWSKWFLRQYDYKIILTNKTKA